MSIVATCAVEDMAATNAALDAAGHGPSNFSVPLFGNGDRAVTATLHAWTDAAFLAALEQLPNVTINTDFNNDPQAAMQAMLNAQGLVWPSNAPMLPDIGTVMPGGYYRTADGVGFRFWRIITQFSRDTFPDPPDQLPPAIIREARIPGTVNEWQQPIDQFDAYLTLDPFTGQPERAIYNGQVIEAQSGSAGGPGGSLLNVFNPGDPNSGWVVVETGDPVPAPTGPEPWVQPTGAGDAYQTGARVIHDNPNDGGANWIYESKIDANTAEPGRDGTFDRWWEPISAV